MTLLGKSAAIASIVAAIFTVAAYFSNNKDNIVTDVSANIAVNNDKKKFIEIEKKQTREELVEPKVSTHVINDESEKKIRTNYEIALMIPGTITKNDRLEELAKEAITLGYIDTAYEIITDISGTITRSSMLSELAIAIAKTGDMKFALKVANEIPGTITKSNTLEEMSRL